MLRPTVRRVKVRTRSFIVAMPLLATRRFTVFPGATQKE
jgi:hypothetical protein